MISLFKIVCIIIISYMLGGLSFGWMVARMKGVNILEEGSGNPGFTNAWRTLGMKTALLVLLGDALKGFVAVWLGHMIADDLGMMVAFLCVIVGHSYSYMLHFKGGKGIATAAGALVYISPVTLLVLVLIVVILVGVTKYMSLGSIVVAALCPLCLYLDHQSPIVYGTVSVVAIYVIWLHRSNIKRLLNGTENKIGAKRS